MAIQLTFSKDTIDVSQRIDPASGVKRVNVPVSIKTSRVQAMPPRQGKTEA